MSTICHDLPAAAVGTATRPGIAAWFAPLRRFAHAVRCHFAAERARRELERLDDATLRDIGLQRSEITSLVAEAYGAAETSRRRAQSVFAESVRS